MVFNQNSLLSLADSKKQKTLQLIDPPFQLRINTLLLNQSFSRRFELTTNKIWMTHICVLFSLFHMTRLGNTKMLYY